MGDLGDILGLAVVAMANPALLAAVTIMMLLPKTKTLMLGYLLGAYLTSIAVGLLIVFSLHGSGSVETARNTLSPGGDLVVGMLALVVAFVLGTERGTGLRERRSGDPEEEKPARQSWPERMLARGSARISFAVGVVLSFPGVAYLAALDRIAELDAAVAPTALLVIAFCLIQMLLLELPLVGFALAPERTQAAVARFRAWLARSGRRAGAGLALAIGLLLVARGVVELLT